MRILFVLFVPLLAGCASKVAQTGDNTFMISGKSAGLGASQYDASAKIYEEARAYCAQRGKKMEEVKSENRGPGFARLPAARLDFRCVAK